MNKAEKEKLDEAKKKATEANTTMNSDRLAKLEAIADNKEADELRREEEVGIERPEPEEEVQAKKLQEEGATEVEDPDTKSSNGLTYYRQIVNGREKWQTLDEIRRTAAKVDSGDDYLRQAAEGARKAAELALSKDESASLSEDEAQKLLAEIALGDVDATRRLASVLSGLSKTPRGVPQDVLQQIDQRLSFRTELARLEDEYKDLLGDEDLGDLFRAKLSRMKDENPHTTIADAYHSIGKSLRTRFSATTKLQEKLERKRSLPLPMNTGTRAGTGTETESEEEYNASVIEQMAKARGQDVKVYGPNSSSPQTRRT